MLSALHSRTSPTLVVVPLAVLLAGCGALTGQHASGNGHEAVGSFYPLAWVTEEVAGDDWTVTNLTSPGGEPHDLELSIDATAALADADLVVYLDQFQPAVDDAVADNAEGEVLDAADVVDLRPMAAHDHLVDPGDDHGDVDPHFWQDPARMADLARAVADDLAGLDPQHAKGYQQRADRLVTRLDRLDHDYAAGLSGCERTTVVVSHDAFSYLDKYGLHLEPIAGLNPGAEPTPAMLAQLAELIRDDGLTTVFYERLASPAMAEALASDLGVEAAVLDPIEGLTDQTSQEDYLSLMRANLTALEKANGC